MVFLSSTILMGLGATLSMDLWTQFIKRVFKMKVPNYCLVGRWLRFAIPLIPVEIYSIGLLVDEQLLRSKIGSQTVLACMHFDSYIGKLTPRK